MDKIIHIILESMLKLVYIQHPYTQLNEIPFLKDKDVRVLTSKHTIPPSHCGTNMRSTRTLTPYVETRSSHLAPYPQPGATIPS